MQGGGAEDEREVESRPSRSGSFLRCRRVHIVREGHEVVTDEDEPGAGSGKHPLGDASHSGLWHFVVKCGADDPKVDIFTSPDLHSCHLVGSEEKRQFLAGTYRRICMPEAEFMLSNEPVDDLTTDLEVAGIRDIMLAQAAHRRHGYVETELQEKVSDLEKSKAELKTEQGA